jgi:protein-S-isoprenylcysteine O-methyltransferase Ste14
MAQTQNANSAAQANQPKPRKFWMRWRVRLGYPVAILYWVLATPTRHSITYGAIVAAFGLIVRAEAAGYLRKDRELAVTGPYARTRNPLYLGSAILAAAFVVAGHSPAAGALVGIYFATFYLAVMRNEEEDLRGRFGPEFEEYAARVPLFFPQSRVPRTGRNDWGSWHGLAANVDSRAIRILTSSRRHARARRMLYCSRYTACITR